MRDVTLVIFNSLRIHCHIRRPLGLIVPLSVGRLLVLHAYRPMVLVGLGCYCR